MNKKIVITKQQLKETVKNAIIMHERKKYVQNIVKEELEKQIDARNTAKQLLEAGPLSNVWAGIKQAGREFGSGVAKAGKRAVAAGQQAAQKKAAQSQVTSALQAVSQAKSKFNKEQLKTAETINAYHDSVVGLYNTLQQVASTMGSSPEMLKVVDATNQAVGQLQYDLESEKEGIDSFLQSLSQEVGKLEAERLGATSREKSQSSRGSEAEQYGQSKVSQLGSKVRSQYNSSSPSRIKVGR